MNTIIVLKVFLPSVMRAGRIDYSQEYVKTGIFRCVISVLNCLNMLTLTKPTEVASGSSFITHALFCMIGLDTILISFQGGVSLHSASSSNEFSWHLIIGDGISTLILSYTLR